MDIIFNVATSTDTSTGAQFFFLISPLLRLDVKFFCVVFCFFELWIYLFIYFSPVDSNSNLLVTFTGIAQRQRIPDAHTVQCNFASVLRAFGVSVYHAPLGHLLHLVDVLQWCVGKISCTHA